MTAQCNHATADGKRRPVENQFQVELAFPAIVTGIQAGIVKIPIHSKPIRLVDASAGRGFRSRWKCRNHLDPSSLRTRYFADIVCSFRQVLVLTEHDRDVQLISSRHPNHVETDP